MVAPTIQRDSNGRIILDPSHLPTDPQKLAEVKELVQRLESGLYRIQPRPDQPERYDQQESFVNEKVTCAILQGGNGSGTTLMSLLKMVKLVLKDEPPQRFDHPVAIVSVGYEQCCEIVFKEKLLGEGLLPRCEIDWDRIDWFKPKIMWPFKVPLRSWPNEDQSKNYVLEFLSSDSSVNRFSGRAFAGIFVVEPIPWGAFQELYRGMREILGGGGGKHQQSRYGGKGRICYEFTPVDPVATAELEYMTENNTLPHDWKVYRCNTQCALEAGHVSQEWFDSFYSMIPEEMRNTRLTGEYPVYEGAIYPSYNPAIHCADEMPPAPAGVYHKRGIDWGAGTENALCVLWSYLDSVGVWRVYDEYYTTRQDWTWEQHARAIHAKDGWDLVREGSDYEARYKLVPLPGKQRWRYGDPHFQQTYADPNPLVSFREFDRYCLPCSAANNFSVLEGINSVRLALEWNEQLKSPGVVIDKSKCPNLARQLRTYRWMKGGRRGMNPKDAKKEPLKHEDHAPDALRYLLHTHRVGRGKVDNTTANVVRRPGALISRRFRSNFQFSSNGLEK